ncbi:unnamed protein product [Penicillium glandicola]
MSVSRCNSCPSLDVLQWHHGDEWRTTQAYPEDLLSPDQSEGLAPIFKDYRVYLIIASATNIRTCQRCRQALSRTFHITEAWWSLYYKRSNGFFGNTWSYFEVKQLRVDMTYEWNKLNIFTRWIPSTKQTIVLLFDPQSPIKQLVPDSLLNPDITLLDNPYWVYSKALESIAQLEETAVWAIRDRVRAIETEDKPEEVPKPDYRRLHDIGRHAVHVTETLSVAVQTIESIQKHYMMFMALRTSDRDSVADQDIRARLEFFRGYIANLRHRSISNEKRLQNEIQLAFNTVAQHNAGTSVEIGRAAQIDSSAMKTIAFVTLIFLPPTFISSIFGMSFFQCGEDNGWGMSNKFWVYWVFAIPTTIATVMVWQYWHNIFPALLSVLQAKRNPLDSLKDAGQPGAYEMQGV